MARLAARERGYLGLVRAVLLSVLLAACGSSDEPHGQLADAPSPPPDAAPDAPCPRVLFQGGTDPVAQGWTVIQQQPATLTNGVDDVALATSTDTQTNRGGQLLLARAGAVDPALPFALEIVLRVDSVTRAHNALDSATAIMGSLTGAFGNEAERSQMIYIDTAAIGFADDMAGTAVAAALVDGAFHTYVLAVDAAHTATLSVDGVPKLSRASYATNGTIAIGDQTNDASYDSALRLKRVTRLCPAQ